MTDGSSDDSHRDLDPSLEPEFASLLSRHKEAVAKTEWSYQQFLPPEIEKHSLSPTAYMGRDGIADRGEPALVHGWPRSRPGELPGPDPGVRARLDVGGGSARDPARELPPADEKRGSGRPGALAEGHDRGGWSHALAGPFQGMVYTAMQEAATRTFYLCVTRACGDEDPLLGAALRRIAKDETLHMAFYRDVVKAHLDKDPDYLRPLAAVMVRFEMPWSSSVLHDFEERRAYLATRGVFRLSDYLDEVVQPLWSYWGLEGRTLEREETRRAFVQLRRYRAALRKF